jgi:hypothetical protein
MIGERQPLLVLAITIGTWTRRRAWGFGGAEFGYHGPQPEQAGGTEAGGHDRIRKTGWSGAIASICSSVASGPTPWKNMPTSNFHFFR